MTRGSYLAGLGFAAAVCATALSCYSTGDGSAPPQKYFYFPVGLVVSPNGRVLYVANSDFDLQWNGGTVQAYDLRQIRLDAAKTIDDPQAAKAQTNPPVPFVPWNAPDLMDGCPTATPDYNGTGQRTALGSRCAPATDSSTYVRRTVTIGAFATDLQMSLSLDRLFMPVRGDASVTWIDVASDAAGDDAFQLNCNADATGRCDINHHAGNRATEPGNTRAITMPGEPFGMAQSADGTSILVTHQNDTKTSLLSTGIAPVVDANGAPVMNGTHPVFAQTRGQTPALQFVLDGLPLGGNGITSIPHDPAAFDTTTPPPPAAFIQTSRSVAEIDLLHYYADQSNGTNFDQSSSLHRPFILKAASYPVTANASGLDSRGIVIDDTPRRACKAGAKGDAAQLKICARTPARVFIANRAPASIIFGEIGEVVEGSSGEAGTYDPDKLVIFGNQPLTAGPSNLFLAPVIDPQGNYSLRVFIVCFDSATVFVWDPLAGKMENIIRVGQGPFAMAFDPFDMDDVAVGNAPPKDTYRFGYVGSFTDSFVQLLDLDQRNAATYERVGFTLGTPTLPKGTQ